MNSFDARTLRNHQANSPSKMGERREWDGLWTAAGDHQGPLPETEHEKSWRI